MQQTQVDLPLFMFAIYCEPISSLVFGWGATGTPLVVQSELICKRTVGLAPKQIKKPGQSQRLKRF